MLKNSCYRKVAGIGSLCLFLLGCSKESFLISEEGSSTVVLEEAIVLEEEKNLQNEKQNPVLQTSLKEGELVLQSEKESEGVNPQSYREERDAAALQKKEIAVHICGAVNQPGVYYFEENQRLYEAVLKAGGFREDADEDYLNQALFLEDGMKITVPTKEETLALMAVREEDFIQPAAILGSGSEELVPSKDADEDLLTGTGKVDLNTADETLLCTLPGIGESRAKSIVAYRTEHGSFKNTEDIMKVSGIKEAAYEKIKDYVTVSK